jgi:nicotinamide mononucleotide transporter
MVALTASSALLAIGMYRADLASLLEAAAFVTGAICVWLTVRASIWNFPVGLVNVAAYSIVFFRAHLYGDAGLQIIYFALGAMGWIMWLRRDGDGSVLQISRASRRELVSSIAFAVVATGGLWQVLAHTGSSASFLDALTTSISLVAQWLLNRKRLESWIGWILVDIIYIPLYLSKGLTLTAILYAVFLVMAVLGYREWLRMWRAQHPEERSPLQTVQAR